MRGVGLSIFALCLCACPASPAVQRPDATPDSGAPDGLDAAFDAGVEEADAGSDAGTEEMSDAGDEPDGGSDAGTPCEPAPSTPVEISRSVTFCPGQLSIAADATRHAALQVVASGVTVTCLDTVFSGASGFGTTEDPTVGILIDGVQDVRVVGCGVHGFRYGLVAREVERLAVESADLSDNFTDPLADWVQDTVQGGGIRLENTRSSTVSNSSFARNWNGIELRGSDDNTISTNTADHCSNTGATLVNAHRDRLEGNDLSWGIRGDQLSFPGRWYGIDTKDSAGIIVDALSSDNELIRNDTTYGGDGIFVRSVIGGCATSNLIEGNDTSFSPHNAIECWCDGNRFIDNIASDSTYGLWLGGTDLGVVRGNLVERNLVDGISIQIGEDRHTVIEDNVITDNGRTGVLLTGREIQAWDPLDRMGPNLANSSQLVIQRNAFANNGPCSPFTGCDVFVASTRGLVMGSNCGDGMSTVAATPAAEVEGIWTVGACGADPQDRPPEARLAPISATAGVEVTLDASASSDPEGAALGYHWLVQRSGARFVPAALPEALLVAPGASQVQLTFPSAGLWDVAVTADDGALAGLAFATVAVLPDGLEIGATALDWSWRCTDPACTTVIVEDTSASVSGGASIRIATDDPYDFAAFTPPDRQAAWDFSSFTHLAGFFRSQNRNMFGWQGNFPTFVLGSASGTVTLTPDSNLLPLEAGEWIYVDVPLAGGQGWTRTETGAPVLTDVDWLEVHTDTWDYGTYYVWLDGLILH